jgi:hypothetical protein
VGGSSSTSRIVISCAGICSADGVIAIQSCTPNRYLNNSLSEMRHFAIPMFMGVQALSAALFSVDPVQHLVLVGDRKFSARCFLVQTISPGMMSRGTMSLHVPSVCGIPLQP